MYNWLIVALALLATGAFAASKDLGNDFTDHGVASPMSNHRGTVVTVDGNGRNVVLSWLMDHRGGYELLMVDAETGKSEEFPMPAPWGGEAPFASILASNNRFYTHYGPHFYEFDPVARKWASFHKTAHCMAMSMTEDDNGTIWSATYPNSGLVSYNPTTQEFKDYGSLYKQNWAQYPRYVAADDTGYIYFGIGSTASQIIALNPVTGEATPLVPEADRVHGSGSVYRDMNGKVYGHDGGTPGKWMELYKGVRTDLPAKPEMKLKPIIASSQSLFHNRWADGQVLKALDLINRKLVVADKEGKERTLDFDYASDGAHGMSVNAAPNGTICGGTAFPMRFFSYDPKTDKWVNEAAFLQFNTVATQGDKWFTGGYTHGFLLEWDPTQPWANTKKGEQSNPLWLAEAGNVVNRPHDLLAHPDGKTLIMAGTPGYGLTGGGLLIWDRETKQARLLTHTELLPEQSTMAQVALPDGKVLSGTTIAAGTGGAVKAKLAEMYVFDVPSGKIEWHAPVLPNVSSYTDLCAGPESLVYGFADSKRFFVFDSKTRQVIHENDIEATLGRTSGGQGPRVFVKAPDGTTYILLSKGIAKLDPKTYEIKLLAESPVPVVVGGDYLDGRIYFVSASHVYSWKVQ